MTPWPANISWALLADRRSCYAGAELALPFAPLSAARRAEIDAQFIRVFAGNPAPGDVAQLAGRYRCDVVVITAQDGAWLRDPFARLGGFPPGRKQARGVADLPACHAAAAVTPGEAVTPGKAVYRDYYRSWLILVFNLACRKAPKRHLSPLQTPCILLVPSSLFGRRPEPRGAA